MKEYKKQKYMKTWNSLKKRLKTCTLANNHTHVQNFLLAFIDELWKTWKIIILKNLKKKKMLEVSSFYTCIPRYSSWDTETHNFFCHFGPFLPFLPLPPNNPQNQNFEKMKKAFGYVIIFNLCNKKHDRMMYVYSYMECDKHNFLSF